MIKMSYLIGAGLVLMWLKGRKTEVASNQLADTMASQQGSDWIGSGGLYALWDRLSGADLVSVDYPNASGGASADFSKVDRRAAQLMPGWDGGL